MSKIAGKSENCAGTKVGTLRILNFPEWGSVYEANVRDLGRLLTRRKGRVEKSLSLLVNHDSQFADDHRRLIRLYEHLIDTFNRECGGTFE